jgi:DNA-binding SARP family transcriptional activator
MLRIHLLGGFRLQSGDEIITTLTVPRLQSLLAYLVLHGENPQLRQHLAFLFWPDSTEAQARTNLRHMLHDLRLALPDAEVYLDIQTQWVQWRPDSAFTLDVSEFETAHLQAEQLILTQQTGASVTALARAVELYRGPFLSGCYDEWALVKREEFAQQFGQALDRLLNLLESQRDYAAAIGYAQRLLRHDPLAETTYQRLMRLYALHGDRAGALRVYHECVAMLERELGVEPSVETRAAYAQLFTEDVTATPPTEQPVRTGDTPILIGREVEWQQLLLAWQRALQGHAQVVAITGEAGIGKTRLAESLASWVNRQGLRAASARAYEAEGGLAYAPLIDLLRTETLAPGLSELSDVWLAQVARLLPELRDRHPRLARAEPATEIGERQHFYEALARAALADGRPLLLALDDLHWCDGETLEWLRYLLRFAPQAKLLLVVTVRSGEAAADHPLHAFLLSLRREHRLTEIPLARLTHAHTAVLAAHMVGRALEASQADDLYRQTDGNPLFVVEMMRAHIARWAAGGASVPASVDSPDVVLPESVQAVIQARLAQLTPLAQEAARLAAVIGRSFSFDVLAHAGGYDEDELVRGLDELWQRHILREQAANEYDFSHPHIREVAYRQISPMRRRLLHRRAAQALETVYAQGAEAMSGLVAAHYELAGDAKQAVLAYQRAAHFAKQTYAYPEAAEHLRRGLALLATLPDHDTRHRQELELQLDLGLALMVAKGLSDQEAQQAYSRALELCRYAGADVQMYEAIWGLHESYLFQGNQAKAHEACEHCWHLAQQIGDPELLMQTHHAFMAVYHWFYPGANGPQSAVDHAQQGIALYMPEQHHTHMLRFAGHDPGVCMSGMAALDQWLLGYPDQAMKGLQDTLALATRLGHASTLYMALEMMTKLYLFRREPAMVLDTIGRAQRIAFERKLHTINTYLSWFQGWAQGQTNPGIDAVDLIRHAISGWRESGFKVEQSLIFALLAETCDRAGQTEGAWRAVEQGMEITQATGEDYYRPELHRLHGRLLLAAGDIPAAQASFWQALELAQQQRVKSLELRAAMDLSRLWAEQDRRAQAYALLSSVYAWFTEGFDTADLREAQALLNSLTPS